MYIYIKGGTESLDLINLILNDRFFVMHNEDILCHLQENLRKLTTLLSNIVIACNVKTKGC